MTGHVLRGVDPRTAIGFVGGLALTSLSLSSGFVWASQGRAPLVVAAATGAWLGYLVAHHAVTGTFVDEVGNDADSSGGPEGMSRYAGIAVGAAILVAGMYVGAGTIRSADHLLTNVGGVLFLGGYVVAHYAATGRAL